MTHELNCSGVRSCGSVILREARIGGQLDFTEAWIANPEGAALAADWADVGGSIVLHNSQCTGLVSLLGVRVGAALVCLRSSFTYPNGPALIAMQATAGSNLVLQESEFLGGVSLHEARVGGLVSCDRSEFSNAEGVALSAWGIVSSTGITMVNARFSGRVILDRARIGGGLNCSEAQFEGPPDTPALACAWAVVDGNLWLTKAQCSGQVNLYGTRVGRLTCSEASFANSRGVALRADKLIVDTEMDLDQAQFIGRVDLDGAHIVNSISCEGTYFSTPDGIAVYARGLIVDKDLNLSETRCSGQFHLGQAHVGRNVDCTKAEFSRPDKTAFWAHGLTVGSDLNLTEVKCIGGFQLSRAHVGEFSAGRASFSNQGGIALQCTGLVVDADLFLHDTHFDGRVHIDGAHVGRRLSCSESSFTSGGGYALYANKLVVGAALMLNKSHFSGEVDLSSASTGERFSCVKTTFSNRKDSFALNGSWFAVGGTMYLSEAEFQGSVLLFGARIGGDLHCIGTSFVNCGSLALSMRQAVVSQQAWMRPRLIDGELDLTFARVGAWNDEKRTWPERIHLRGFTYDAIDAPDASIADRLQSWLPRDSYAPEPYEQLAGVYRREGNDKVARTIAIGNQRARRATYKRGWARWPQAAWSAFLRWTIAYGYRPALVLLPLAVLLLAGSIVFQIAYRYPAELHGAKAGAEQPSFNSVRYTIDLLMPVVNLRQRDSFVTDGWAAWASFGFTFLGWLLAAVVVAGLGGVFKRP